MRNRTFYVITEAYSENVGYCPAFYTPNEFLAKDFIRIHKDSGYKILEFQGDNIIELEDIIRSQVGVSLEPKEDLLTTLYSNNLPISVITSANYFSDSEYFTLLPDIIKILVSSWHNIIILKDYFSIEYKSMIDIIIKVLYKYICRLVLFDNVCISEVPMDIRESLGLVDNWDVDDIVDDVLIFYMFEYGWGEK